MVNDYLQTNDPDIFAIGEIAEHNGMTLGITSAAEKQADVLARFIHGDLQSTYDGAVPMNILKLPGLDLCSIGIPEIPANNEGYDEILFIDKSMRYYKKCIIKDDRLVGAILVGDKSEFAEFKSLIENKVELSEKRLQLLRSGKKAEPVIGKLICSCNQVGAGNLHQLINEGGKSLHELCQRSGAGLGIKASDRLRWQKLMGKFGINERHSSLELNWHLPVIDSEALELKRFLVRELDQQDISTHGLTFTIKTNRDILYFTTVVIEKNLEKDSLPGDHYNILYAKNFSPTNITYHTYARALKKEMIPAFLIDLSKLYFRQLNPEKEKSEDVKHEPVLNGNISLYQCSNCLTIYDKQYGDPEANISAGVAFENLPESYKCHVCDSPKKYFLPI